ncbi:polysaccharide deacetylase family protein [Qipengyuania sp. SM2507]
MLAYITIDTEYSSGMVREAGADCRAENFACAISGRTEAGEYGLGYKLDMFNSHGHRGVCFVDPMPALLWGVAAIEDVVGPILERGHDVQLHLHTEWLELAGAAHPLGRALGSATGRNIKDFTFEQQCTLIDWARDTLMKAGAAAPVAFRAGNYGANDTTLRALAECGIGYDPSHTPGIAGGDCDIALGPEDRVPLRHQGVIEVPIGCIATVAGGLRHAQITALSAREMVGALRHARDAGTQSFTMVSHSFELVNRRRGKVNRIVRRRFERLCDAIARMKGVRTGTYVEDPPPLVILDPADTLVPANPVAETLRVAEQLASNTLYG